MLPRALVIPFGVPDGGKGLGLGLASLVHSFTRIGDGDVALAQIRSHGSDGGVTGIVEAFVTGAQWKAMPGAEDTPAHVLTVLTGAFDPPREGGGTFSVLAFDAKSGEPRAMCEAVLDAEGAGRSIVGALAHLCLRVGGDVGGLRGIEALGWDALESVLLAETWRVRALSGADPGCGVAALAHLGRAVAEAHDATFPAERLATMAVELARQNVDARAIEAALRTLDTAIADAPTSAPLEAAAAALCLRLGRPVDAIARAERAIERDPARAFSHTLFAEAKRVNGDWLGAERAITTAAALDNNDPHVRNERAAICLAMGDTLGAQMEWQKLLTTHPMHMAAFANLATIALEREDATLAQSLVDHVLAVRAGAPMEMLRGAVAIALRAEPASVARGARLESLCRVVVEREPKDWPAMLLLARAVGETGEREAALLRLTALEQAAKGTAVAAEAARVRLQLLDPLAAAAVDATIRTAREAGEPATLAAVAVRARRLGDEHESWVAYLAAAIAEGRLGHLERALANASHALSLADSAPLVHLELATILLARREPAHAREHARRALTLDPSLARAEEVLAEAVGAEASNEAKRPSWIDKLLRR